MSDRGKVESNVATIDAIAETLRSYVRARENECEELRARNERLLHVLRRLVETVTVASGGTEPSEYQGDEAQTILESEAWRSALLEIDG